MSKKHDYRNDHNRASQDNAAPVKQLALTATAAMGSALLGALLAQQGLSPKWTSGALAALGAGLCGVADSAALRAVGSGAMSGSAAQLASMAYADHLAAKAQARTTALALATTTIAAVTEQARPTEPPPPVVSVEPPPPVPTPSNDPHDGIVYNDGEPYETEVALNRPADQPLVPALHDAVSASRSPWWVS
jgi:hypothetical protein